MRDVYFVLLFVLTCCYESQKLPLRRLQWNFDKDGLISKKGLDQKGYKNFFVIGI